MRLRHNQHGMALVGVLALAASVSALAAVLVIMYERLQHENAVLHVHSETNSLARYVKNVLIQPDLCKAAFTDLNNSPVVWTGFAGGRQIDQGPTADFLANRGSFAKVPQIWVQSTVGAHSAAVIGQVFSPAGTPVANENLGTFRLVDMYLRRSYQELDQYARDDGTIIDPVDQKTYTTVTAKLVMQFYYCTANDNSCNKQSPITTKVLADNANFRNLDVVVALDSTGAIHSCYQPSFAQALNMTCGRGSNIYPTFDQECQGTINPACTKTWSLTGYDDFGKPQCACHVTCQSYAKGAPGGASYNSGGAGTDGMAPLIAAASTTSSAYTSAPFATGSSAPAPGIFQLTQASPPPTPSVDINGNYLPTQGTYSTTQKPPDVCTGDTCIKAGANSAEPAVQ